MKASEILRREDFAGILRRTLQSGLTQRYREQVAVDSPDAKDSTGTLWRFQSLLGVCWGSGLGQAGRRYLAESIRRTPVPTRRHIQYLAATALCTAPGLTLTSRPAFRLSSEIVTTYDTLVLPGNRRIRLVFLDGRPSLVLAKEGFSRTGMKAEIGIRGGVTDGPFPRIHAHAPDWSWFEEPLLDVLPLPRCPPSWRPVELARRAADALDTWTAPTARHVVVGDYLTALCQRLRIAGASSEWPELQRLLSPGWLDCLSASAAKLESLEIRQSHGDFQPGNILIERSTHQPLLSDWETASWRSSWYDHLVFSLATRWGGALAARIDGFIREGKGSIPIAATGSVRRRRQIVSLFLLEEFDWLANESTAGPFRRPAAGVFEYIRELQKFGSQLESLIQ